MNNFICICGIKTNSIFYENHIKTKIHQKNLKRIIYKS